MRGQIEGDAEALLAGLDVLPVELVALLDGGEAGVLADRPRPLGVHGGVRAARERELARQLRRHAGEEREDVRQSASCWAPGISTTDWGRCVKRPTISAAMGH